jgi:hypothetical protein
LTNPPRELASVTLLLKPLYGMLAEEVGAAIVMDSVVMREHSGIEVLAAARIAAGPLEMPTTPVTVVVAAEVDGDVVVAPLPLVTVTAELA